MPDVLIINRRITRSPSLALQTNVVNMREAGEPSFEHDFPSGSDMLKEICEGLTPVERLEMELSFRLQGWKRRQYLLQ